MRGFLSWLAQQIVAPLPILVWPALASLIEPLIGESTRTASDFYLYWECLGPRVVRR